MADMNWFMQNAPQMQPGGGGFQEQLPGAVWGGGFDSGQADGQKIMSPLAQAAMTSGQPLDQKIMSPLAQAAMTSGQPMGGGPPNASDIFRYMNTGVMGSQAPPPSGMTAGGLFSAFHGQGPFAGLMSAGQLGPRQGGGWAGNMAQGMGSVGNVLLRAPDGSTKSVPAGEMSHWLGRGAVRF